jgi:hypothetical protein
MPNAHEPSSTCSTTAPGAYTRSLRAKVGKAAANASCTAASRAAGNITSTASDTSASSPLGGRRRRRGDAEWADTIVLGTPTRFSSSDLHSWRLGWQTRLVSVVLAIFCVVTASQFHFHPGQPMQMTNFMKNLLMAALLASRRHTGRPSPGPGKRAAAPARFPKCCRSC